MTTFMQKPRGTLSVVKHARGERHTTEIFVKRYAHVSYMTEMKDVVQTLTPVGQPQTSIRKKYLWPDGLF